MNKSMYSLVIVIFSVFISSCGGSGAIVDGKIPFSNKNVIIFQSVSQTTINDFREYFNQNYINTNYYPKHEMNCEELGFTFTGIKYLEYFTYLSKYIDSSKVYNCFEVTSGGDGYKGQISSILTADYL